MRRFPIDMGRRSGTAIAIMAAFHARTTWMQQDLAREIGVTSRTLRATLIDLRGRGIPLEQEIENRSLVYWSVPRWWARGLEGIELATCTRLLARLPATSDRDRMLARLLRRDTGDARKSTADIALETLEDTCANRKVARITYRSTRDGVAAERLVSVQRIDHRDPARFIAVCHRSNALKTFRVDRVDAARTCEGVAFRAQPAHEIDEVIARSFDGYDAGEAIACVFVARDPESRWIAGALPRGDVEVERVEGGVRISVRTSAMTILARHLVGFADLVHIETPELAAAVADIVRRAVAARKRAVTAQKRAPAVEPRPLARAGRRNSASGVAKKSVNR